MKRKFLITLLLLIFGTCCVFGDAFVPEFDKMKILRCDYEETIFNQDNSVVTKNKLFRVFRIDDEYKKFYLGKEQLKDITYFESDRIEFDFQSMTDDFIMLSHTIINRTTGEYSSSAELTYDNPVFGVRHSKSTGICKIVN